MGTSVAPFSPVSGPPPDFTPDIPAEWLDGPVTLPNSTPLVSTPAEALATEGTGTLAAEGTGTLAAEGAGTLAAEGTGTGLATGTAVTTGLASFLAIGAGILVFLWPASTAPAWRDELNPVTGMPYRNKQEYEDVGRLSEDEINRRRAAMAKEKLVKAKKSADTVGDAPVCSAQQPCPLQAAANASSQPNTGTSTQTQSSRKYADQTCEDEVREELQRQKNNACNKPRSCVAQKLGCPEILSRISQNQACLASRQRMRDECFGGVGDDEHKGAMVDVQKALDRCLLRAKEDDCL